MGAAERRDEALDPAREARSCTALIWRKDRAPFII
jgi:hypothetical protein